MNQETEKTALLTSASLLISVGVVAITENIWAGIVLVSAGVGLYYLRELRKKA